MAGHPGPRRPKRAARRLLSWLAGMLIVSCCAVPAAAEFTVGGGAHQDKDAPVLFRADEVEYDEQLALTVARGHVEISQNGQVLLADTVSYNQRTDTITASGNVSLTQPTDRLCRFHRVAGFDERGLRQKRAYAARRPLAARGQHRTPYQRQPDRAETRGVLALRPVPGRP